VPEWRPDLKRPEVKTIYSILAVVLLWGLIGWMMISLRNSHGLEQIQNSTLLLRILCAGASLLLLCTCIAMAVGLNRIARESETERRFPPTSAPRLSSLGHGEDEAAWMWAARLRGWAALSLVLGLLIAGAGLSIALRAYPVALVPASGIGSPIRSAPALVEGRQSVRLQTPARSTGAPG
jgi:hypothetical protein